MRIFIPYIFAVAFSILTYCLGYYFGTYNERERIKNTLPLKIGLIVAIIILILALIF